MTHQEFDERLDEILVANLKRAYFNGSTDVVARKNGVIPNDTRLGGVMINQLADEAKQAIRELFMEAIGEDEDDMILNINDACSAEDRNQLRQQLRTTITGKEGGE